MFKNIVAFSLLALGACTTGDIRPHCAAMTSSASARAECIEGYRSGEAYYDRNYQVEPYAYND